MRAFLAIPLPDAVQGKLAAVAAEVRGLRAQKPGTIHLTIRFLGEIRDADAVADAVAPVAAKHRPFDMDLERLGVFPRRGAPRVLWVGLGAGDLQAGALAAGVEDALVSLGFPRERRPWHGHVTLGRFREGGRTPRGLADGGRSFGTVRAASLVLYESTLTPEGAVHQALREMPLQG